MEASSNVKDQRVDEGTPRIFSEIISNNRISTKGGKIILGERVSEIPGGK